MRWLKRLLCLLRGHSPGYKLNCKTQLIECRCRTCGEEIPLDFKGRFW